MELCEKIVPVLNCAMEGIDGEHPGGRLLERKDNLGDDLITVAFVPDA